MAKKRERALLIAEKPSLMAAIRQGYLTDREKIPYDIDFMAQAGHLMTLKMPNEIDKDRYSWKESNLPFVFDYQYKVSNASAYKRLKEIRDAVRSGKYDFIIHAGDPDQEGELLIRETLDSIKNTLPVKRFWSNDLTVDAVTDALKDMNDDSEYDDLYHAALVRQRADYDFGMNLTTAATLKYGGYRNIMNVGRVKAPIMKMVVDREKEIENFTPKTDYRRAFTYKGCEFVGTRAFETEKEACLSKAPKSAEVISAESKTKKIKAPKLFKLSSLQAEAARVFHFNGAKTLSITQSLYQKKVTSYPRTDCEYIFSTTDLEGIAESTRKNMGIDKALLKRSASAIRSDIFYTNDKAASMEGHTAIIPTGRMSKLSPDEMKIYSLIARRFLAVFGEFKEVHQTRAEAVIDGEGKDIYSYSASETTNPGYEEILGRVQKKEGKVRDFEKGEVLKPVKFQIKEHTTKPPVRYNDASLILALDNPERVETDDGKAVRYRIGTPATRGNIIEQLVKGDFLTQDKKTKAYSPTEKARLLERNIGDTSLFNIRTSGEWESRLDDIRMGKTAYDRVEKELHEECVNVTADICKREPQKYIHKSAPEVPRKSTEEIRKYGRTDVNIPYSVKNLAKKEGARWDGKKKTWYFEGYSKEEVSKKASYIAKVAKMPVDQLLNTNKDEADLSDEMEM